MEERMHHCRVCGIYVETAPWGEDGNCPTYEICNCCGVEFGYEDYTIESTKEFRSNWLSNGANWFEPKAKPHGWNIDEQMQYIPLEFR